MMFCCQYGWWNILHNMGFVLVEFLQLLCGDRKVNTWKSSHIVYHDIVIPGLQLIYQIHDICISVLQRLRLHIWEKLPKVQSFIAYSLVEYGGLGWPAAFWFRFSFSVSSFTFPFSVSSFDFSKKKRKMMKWKTKEKMKDERQSRKMKQKRKKTESDA